MDETSARTIQSWRYKPPYAIYNPGSDDVENDIQRFMDPGSPYYGMADEQGELVAYCCFGMEAQVPQGRDKDLHTLTVFSILHEPHSHHVHIVLR
jgi:hypothetical protein